MLQIHICKVHLFNVYLVLWESWMNPVLCGIVRFFNQKLTFHTPSCLLFGETPLAFLGHHFCALKNLSSLLLDSNYNLTGNTKTFPDLYMNTEYFFLSCWLPVFPFLASFNLHLRQSNQQGPVTLATMTG